MCWRYRQIHATQKENKLHLIGIVEGRVGAALLGREPEARLVRQKARLPIGHLGHT